MRFNFCRNIAMMKDEHCGPQHQCSQDTPHDAQINGKEFFHHRKSFHIEQIKKLLALR
jgi:hypothetical protein